MEPVVGLEPTTDGLQNRCSTTELNWRPKDVEADSSEEGPPTRRLWLNIRSRSIRGFVSATFQANAPARAAAASVTFEPGARTAWHTHPLGQTLIVTGGCGRAQHWGGPIEEIRPGDVVWFPPGEKHWHGAAPTIAMTHIAIQEALDAKVVEWMEKVGDEQYRK